MYPQHPVFLSLVTAVHPPRSEHLADTADSVAAAHQLLTSAGHQLEWVVVIDGPGDVPDISGTPGVVEVRRSLGGGVSAARNTGLARASGSHVMSLDHDDCVVGAGVLEVVSDPRFAEVNWVGANNQTLEGGWTSHRLTDDMRFERRWLEEHWTTPIAFHPNCVIARRDAVLELGGWPALTGSQDVGLVLALNSKYVGWGLTPAITAYRHWERQTIASTAWPELKRMDFEFICQWVNARRSVDGLDPIVNPEPSGRSSWPADTTAPAS